MKVYSDLSIIIYIFHIFLIFQIDHNFLLISNSYFKEHFFLCIEIISPQSQEAFCLRKGQGWNYLKQRAH